jgi:hypothetical protein
LRTSTLTLWFAPLVCKGEIEDKLCLSASHYLYPHVQRNYRPLLGQAVREVSPFAGVVLVRGR